MEPGSLADSVDLLQPDSTLQGLTGMVNDTGIRIDVTLTVAGQTICGQLMPAHEFFMATAQLVDDASVIGPDGLPIAHDDDNGMKALSKYYRSVADEVKAPDQEGDLVFPPRHIHVSDAQVVASGGRLLEIGLWRGRLTQVTGWTLGRPTT